MRIVALLASLAVFGVAGSALAGPNAGGTLIAHDPGMTYTSEGAPFPGPAPTLDPPTVDNELPVGVPPDGPGWVWKVYAAFPIGSSPRLKAFVMGAQFGGDVVVLDGGLPGPLDFELPQDGWPTTTGGGVGISFYPLRTDPVVECYWFGGYGELGGIWALAPHPTQQMIFVDDTSPPQEDPIAGLSTIGFGVAGETAYPGPLPVFGACCYPDGHCEFLEQSECATGDWREDVPCDPNPCPQPPEGACCYPDGTCVTTIGAECPTGEWYEGAPCDPNPCPQPPEGACCYPDGTCVTTIGAECPTGEWYEDVPCDPNPCPQPPVHGACCHPDGTCNFIPEEACPTGDWREDVPCDPNPCPQPPEGACCLADGTCHFIPEHACPADDWREGVPCDPNPCPQPPEGACCHPDGTCNFIPEHACPTGDWREGVPCDPNPCPPPPEGACCQPDGTCSFIPEHACPTGDWREGVPCDPNPCPVLPQGACCYSGGQCVYTYGAHCPTGDWREGVPCDPNPCPLSPVGACCFPDGGCVSTYEADCSTGDWREGVPCNPNPCPDRRGGCCLGYTCYYLLESECSGVWLGTGTVCYPNPCCRLTDPVPSGPKDSRAKSEVGPGHGVLSPAERHNPCPGSELYLSFDGSAENGCAWQYGGVVPPDFGSFAEGFSGVTMWICGVQLLLTQVGNATGQPIDVYVWEMDGECGDPGVVLSVAPSVVVSDVAHWPTFSVHDIDTPDALTHDGYGVYAGYWPGGWQGALAGFYCVADLDGLGGLPRTNIAPGIGYPTGWQDPSIVWGPTQALGIGAYFSLWAVPTVPTSWGKIKAMYR